ncbi:phosphate signaling complex PhoU family protein [Sulfurisphaera tokodaii]|uniref:SpoVT-AbrB domain-containing protein n=2 Tax=Sulfurisphaera tokodaii TaxID=111955 RepID=Q970W8_SULTO|nr:phosphate uptake regulator PhoU [Sulfurisphaera tokodaii]BAB66555.1 hypothetical protein STK_14840 [Sulfurisphaera tokodaii str. 7]HII73628.1 phosphate uptake regulator PhoU [Sulfurisphaera tokodaii]
MVKPIVRKIQLTGGSTYIISLPKTWVKQYLLQPGDEIEIFQDRHARLILVPKKSESNEKKEKKISLNCDRPDISFVIREIIAYYMAGFTLLTVSCSKFSSEDRERIKETIRNRLLGAEIIDEDSNSLTIQFLVSEKELSLTKSITRAANISYNMLRDSFKALYDGDSDLSKEIISRDDDVDRFYFYIVRQLSLSIEYPEIIENEKYNLTQLVNLYSVAKSIERVSDHSLRIVDQLPILGKLEEKEIYDHGNEVADFFKSSINAFNEKDKDMSHNIINKEFELLYKNRSLSEKVLNLNYSPKKTSSLLIILDSVRRVIRYSIDIAEATIDLLAKQTEQDEELDN